MDSDAVFECEICGGDGVCMECDGTGEVDGLDPSGIDEFDGMGVGE
ncbi:hypothetical protein [Pseudonocardia adelaidensis]